MNVEQSTTATFVPVTKKGAVYRILSDASLVVSEVEVGTRPSFTAANPYLSTDGSTYGTTKTSPTIVTIDRLDYTESVDNPNTESHITLLRRETGQGRQYTVFTGHRFRDDLTDTEIFVPASVTSTDNANPTPVATATNAATGNGDGAGYRLST
ncbi:hypothetical protein I317_05176 [Kwoniella heveanensis CBS 569]|nr:hypothetical protein I317_05176 [Kwoniella heveanensis CBS 569]